jgi:hypothetical protein
MRRLPRAALRGMLLPHTECKECLVENPTEDAPQVAPEKPAKPDIYGLYIFPFIRGAQSGDRILYSSPSTFFGYYSKGARNYELVCDALKEAKQRGVEIRLMVDIHDTFTAKAAEGLLTFLIDGREIRHLEGLTDYYGITVFSRRGTSCQAAFMSERPKVISYLPGIQIRPFRGMKAVRENMSQEDADAAEAEFCHLWERSGLVGSAIAKFNPVYQARKYFLFLQTAVYVLILAIGLVVGAAFALQNNAIIAWLVASIGVGIFGNLLTGFLGKKFGGN